MTPLTANLKLLYQRPWLLFFELAFLLTYIWAYRIGVGNSVQRCPSWEFIFLKYGWAGISLSVVIPHLIAAEQSHILRKPFSFCLPLHRAVPRRVLTPVVCLINLFWGVFFILLEYSNLSSWELMTQGLAISFLGAIFSVLGIFFGIVRGGCLLFGIWVICLCCSTGCLPWFNIPFCPYLNTGIVSFPIPLILFCIVLLGIFWKSMDGDAIVLSICRGESRSARVRRAQKYGNDRGIQERTRRKLFKVSSTTLPRSFMGKSWGALYKAEIHAQFPVMRMRLVLSGIFIVPVRYLFGGDDLFILPVFLFVPCLDLLDSVVLLHFPLLLTDGRCERCRRSVVWGTCQLAFTFIYAALFFGIYCAVVFVFPHISNHPLQERCMPLILTLAFAPFTLLLGAYFPRLTQKGKMIVYMFFYVLCGLAFGRLVGRVRAGTWEPFSVFLGCVILGVLFLGFWGMKMYQRAYHSDLA